MCAIVLHQRLGVSGCVELAWHQCPRTCTRRMTQPFYVVHGPGEGLWEDRESSMGGSPSPTVDSATLLAWKAAQLQLMTSIWHHSPRVVGCKDLHGHTVKRQKRGADFLDIPSGRTWPRSMDLVRSQTVLKRAACMANVPVAPYLCLSSDVQQKLLQAGVRHPTPGRDTAQDVVSPVPGGVGSTPQVPLTLYGSEAEELPNAFPMPHFRVLVLSVKVCSYSPELNFDEASENLVSATYAIVKRINEVLNPEDHIGLQQAACFEGCVHLLASLYLPCTKSRQEPEHGTLHLEVPFLPLEDSFAALAALEPKLLPLLIAAAKCEEGRQLLTDMAADETIRIYQQMRLLDCYMTPVVVRMADDGTEDPGQRLMLIFPYTNNPSHLRVVVSQNNRVLLDEVHLPVANSSGALQVVLNQSPRCSLGLAEVYIMPVSYPTRVVPFNAVRSGNVNGRSAGLSGGEESRRPVPLQVEHARAADDTSAAFRGAPMLPNMGDGLRVAHINEDAPFFVDTPNVPGGAPNGDTPPQPAVSNLQDSQGLGENVHVPDSSVEDLAPAGPALDTPAMVQPLEPFSGPAREEGRPVLQPGTRINQQTVVLVRALPLLCLPGTAADEAVQYFDRMVNWVLEEFWEAQPDPNIVRYTFQNHYEDFARQLGLVLARPQQQDMPVVQELLRVLLHQGMWHISSMVVNRVLQAGVAVAGLTEPSTPASLQNIANNVGGGRRASHEQSHSLAGQPTMQPQPAVQADAAGVANSEAEEVSGGSWTLSQRAVEAAWRHVRNAEMAGLHASGAVVDEAQPTAHQTEANHDNVIQGHVDISSHADAKALPPLSAAEAVQLNEAVRMKDAEVTESASAYAAVVAAKRGADEGQDTMRSGETFVGNADDTNVLWRAVQSFMGGNKGPEQVIRRRQQQHLPSLEQIAGPAAVHDSFASLNGMPQRAPKDVRKLRQLVMDMGPKSFPTWMEVVFGFQDQVQEQRYRMSQANKLASWDWVVAMMIAVLRIVELVHGWTMGMPMQVTGCMLIALLTSLLVVDVSRRVGWYLSHREACLVAAYSLWPAMLFLSCWAWGIAVAQLPPPIYLSVAGHKSLVWILHGGLALLIPARLLTAPVLALVLGIPHAAMASQIGGGGAGVEYLLCLSALWTVISSTRERAERLEFRHGVA